MVSGLWTRDSVRGRATGCGVVRGGLERPRRRAAAFGWRAATIVLLRAAGTTWRFARWPISSWSPHSAHDAPAGARDGPGESRLIDCAPADSESRSCVVPPIFVRVQAFPVSHSFRADPDRGGLRE